MFLSKEKTDLCFRLSISVTVFGALFKIVPSFLTLLGVIGMVVFLGIQLYQKNERTALDYSRMLLIICFAGNYLSPFFGWTTTHLFTIATKLSLIAFLILYLKKIIAPLLEMGQNRHLLFSGFGREELSYILADMATVYIVIASLFTILGWELGILNGSSLLIVGLFAAVLSIVASPRMQKS